MDAEESRVTEVNASESEERPVKPPSLLDLVLVWLLLYGLYVVCIGVAVLYAGTCFFSGQSCGYIVLPMGAVSVGAAIAAFALFVVIANQAQRWPNRPRYSLMAALVLTPLLLIVAMHLEIRQEKKERLIASGEPFYEDGVCESVAGVDQVLPDYLTVNSFTYNGKAVTVAGEGDDFNSGFCAMLPRTWRPGITAKITWQVTNWRDCKSENHEATVSVERYEEVDNLRIHFLADGTVRAVSSTYAPSSAEMPDSKYPVKQAIPHKEPWVAYPPETHCKNGFGQGQGES